MRLLSVSPGETSVAVAGPTVTPVGVLRFALLLLVITQLGAIPIFDIGSREAPVFVNDILVMAVIAVGGVAMAHARSLRLNDVALTGLVFVAIGALSAMAASPRFGLTAFEVVSSLAYLARWVVYFGIYLVVINCVRRRDIGTLWKAVEATMVVFVAFGIFQSAFLPNFGQMVRPNAKLYLEIDPQGHRLMSTLLEPNIAASMIFIVLLVQIAQLAFGAEVPRWKPALMMVGLVLTVSRSGAAGFIMGMFVILWARGLGTKMVKFLLAMLVVALAALPQLLAFANLYEKLGITDASAMARVVGWQRAIATFVDSPWFGVGFNTYGFVQLRRGMDLYGSAGYSAEGGLLFIMVMTGIVGLLVYVAMMYFALRRCRSVWRDAGATPEERGLCLGAAAGTVGVIIHSAFVNSILTPFVMEMLWLLWGFAFVLSATLRAERARLSPAA